MPMQMSPLSMSLPSQPATTALRSLVEQQVTGQVLVRSQDQPSVVWKLFLTQGKLNFATSDREPPARIRYLLQRYSPELQPLPWPSQCSDYDYLCQHWQQGHIIMAEVKQLLSLISLEAVVQIMAMGNVALDVKASAPRPEPILLSLNVNDLLTVLQGQIKDWHYQGQFIGSLFRCPRIRDRSRFSQVLSQTYSADWAKGLSQQCDRNVNFYSIALELQQDALQLARQLYPLTQQGIVEFVLPGVGEHPPQSPPATVFRDQPRTAPPQSAAPTTGSSPKGSLTSFKIACVDDSPTILQEISNCLKDSDLDFSVFPITNSVRALMWVSRIQPDLILLDVGMPGVDGYALCRMIRGNETFKNIPIVMVTGNTGQLNRAMAMDAGASDYVTKPFTAEGLVSVVKKHLQV